MSISITRQEKFAAGHRLYNPAFSDEKNAEVFGKCANPSGHGHNYTLEVTVEGSIDPETGYIIDLKVLSNLMEEHILRDVDHRNLNSDVEWMRGRIPTAELMAQVFWDRLEPHLPTGSLFSVVVRETDKNWAVRRRVLS